VYLLKITLISGGCSILILEFRSMLTFPRFGQSAGIEISNKLLLLCPSLLLLLLLCFILLLVVDLS